MARSEVEGSWWNGSEEAAGAAGVVEKRGR